MARKQNRRWDDMGKSGIELARLIKHFEVHHRPEGKSPRTVVWYNDALTMLLE